MKVKRTSLKQFLQMSESPVFSRKTIIGLLRSILEPIAKNNPKSLIFTRLLSKEGIEGIIRRVEYCQNVEMYSFFDFAKKNDLVEMEFVLITSGRFSALLIWDFSYSDDKNSTQIHFLLNSSEINEAFDIIQANSRENFSKRFYEFKPERRDNMLMNGAVLNILTILNESVFENDFQEVETAHSLSEREFEAYRKSASKNTREVRHEINNQLGILDIYTKLLEKEFGENKNLNIIKKSIGLISSTLEELKEPKDANLECRSLFETVKKAVDMVRPMAQASSNEIELKGVEMTGYIDEDKYISALINVLKNASEATKNDKIQVELLQENGFAKLAIINHGAKIENPKEIFTSGYSTKGTSGVGLEVSKRYLQMQSGTLELTHSDDKYTCFTITTPLGG